MFRIFLNMLYRDKWKLILLLGYIAFFWYLPIYRVIDNIFSFLDISTQLLIWRSLDFLISILLWVPLILIPYWASKTPLNKQNIFPFITWFIIVILSNILITLIDKLNLCTLLSLNPRLVYRGIHTIIPLTFLPIMLIILEGGNMAISVFTRHFGKCLVFGLWLASYIYVYVYPEVIVKMRETKWYSANFLLLIVVPLILMTYSFAAYEISRRKREAQLNANK